MAEWQTRQTKDLVSERTWRFDSSLVHQRSNMKAAQQLKEADDSRTYKRVKRVVDLSCSLCPPHRVENAGRWVKRGAQKPRRKKTKRR